MYLRAIASRGFMPITSGRGQLKCDGTRAETRFRLSAKRRSPFKSAVALVQSTTGSWGVRVSFYCGSNAGYTMFWISVKGTGYPPHSPVSPTLPLLRVTVCHHISNGLYKYNELRQKIMVNLNWNLPVVARKSLKRLNVAARRIWFWYVVTALVV